MPDHSSRLPRFPPNSLLCFLNTISPGDVEVTVAQQIFVLIESFAIYFVSLAPSLCILLSSFQYLSPGFGVLVLWDFGLLECWMFGVWEVLKSLCLFCV